MRRLLLRVGRRRAAWESDDPSQIIQTEFRDPTGPGPDLRASVYSVDSEPEGVRAVVTQVYAEHAASFIDPPRTSGGIVVDAVDLCPDRSSPGDTLFAFTSAAHRELVLRDEAELRQLVRRILDERASRTLHLSKDEILRYVGSRLSAHDPEWESACAEGGKAEKWRRPAEKAK